MPKKKNFKTIYSRTDARKNLPNLVDRVMDGAGPIYIAGRGVTQAVLMSLEDYEREIKKGDTQPVNFSDTGLAGIWKGRKDMQDSVAWTNSMREEEDSRYDK